MQMNAYKKKRKLESTHDWKQRAYIEKLAFQVPFRALAAVFHAFSSFPGFVVT
jgi:hypothetical protein